MKSKVSFTVPVYNTSRYLRKCLDSLRDQTLRDIEFIIVDDGSTDNSGAICDEYAAKDSRFRVIHQANGGSGVARQTGLDAAKGEYVIVCDSDDWVEPDMYQALYEKAIETGADITCCGYFEEYPDGRSVPKQYWYQQYEGDELIKEVLDNPYSNYSVIKLIRRDFFKKAEAHYDPRISHLEDALILYKLLAANPKLAQIKGNFYHYRQNPYSYTHRITMCQIKQIEYVWNWKLNHFSRFLDDHYRAWILVDLIYFCHRSVDIDKEYYDNLVRELKLIEALRSGAKPQKIMLALAVKVLPHVVVKTMFNLFRRAYHK